MFTKDAVRRQGVAGHTDYQRPLLPEPDPFFIVGLNLHAVEVLSCSGLQVADLSPDRYAKQAREQDESAESGDCRFHLRVK